MKQVCFSGLLGRNDQEEKGGTWGNMVEDFVPDTTDSQDKGRPASHSERAVQCSDPNAMALSIYRGVTYTNTTDEEEESNTALFPNTKNTKHRTSSTRKGDVITSYLFVHMFTVMDL